jgi:hypothetical protein
MYLPVPLISDSAVCAQSFTPDDGAAERGGGALSEPSGPMPAWAERRTAVGCRLTAAIGARRSAIGEWSAAEGDCIASGCRAGSDTPSTSNNRPMWVTLVAG